ncbi:MAG: 16S rRNA (adenine(1518)-N(6)/adenine(1519)-N(6))-dimethyltransferase RsmA [Syntrophomonadaceae bacterium]|jgi:16S rRNA (adenine1518-N6/adenine1519-N6)-dimethyltransferase
MITAESLTQVKKIMAQYNFSPRKKWGQNFLIDGNILNKIASSCNSKGDHYIVEIGPGMGSLTAKLANYGQGILAVDIDSKLASILKDELAEYNNIKLLFADILKINLEYELCKAFALSKIPPYEICANIPYNITTPIIFYLLENCPHMLSATLMMQKEVAQRIMACPGSKAYGLLTLMTSYYANSEILMNVSRNCFYPRPEVDSAVLKLTPRNQRINLKDEKVFKALLRASFQKRRKTILNICTEFTGQNKKNIQGWLQQSGISPLARPENLKLEDFAWMADNLPLQEA